MKPGFFLGLPALFAGLGIAPRALADEASDAPPATLGMDPAAPQSQALPGGTTPLMGEPAGPDWRFDFHGVLRAPLRVGINKRPDARPGQSKLVLHTPPSVPDDREPFSHTGVTPTPYGQLNFSYGTEILTGTASIVADQPSVSSGFFDPSSQLGINDLFLTILPKVGENTRLVLRFGAFSDRYGAPGEYDEGHYGMPLIARTNGVGENVSAAFKFDDITVMVEQGIQGQTNKPSNQVTPDVWNNFADPRVGSSFVHHLHAGVGYKQTVTLGGHYLGAWSQDDRATGSRLADGRIDVVGGDLRLTMGRFGHFYGAMTFVKADYARTVGRVIEILNVEGGPGLMQHYLGPDRGPTAAGTGKLLIMGGQYDLSVGRLVSYPVPFSGDGPDIRVSLFGAVVQVKSNDKTIDPRPRGTSERAPKELFDDVVKLKYGLEGTYTLLSWLGVGARFDQVTPMASDQKRSFAVISPRVLFHTDWQSRDLILLQYSRFMYGAYTEMMTGQPPVPSMTVPKDKDMIALSANMWW
jgi:hypothetical protein